MAQVEDEVCGTGLDPATSASHPPGLGLARVCHHGRTGTDYEQPRDFVPRDRAIAGTVKYHHE